ncbi:hypothetical protein AbraIFM66951_008218 [Aspergillus brasiliensis]|uniref:Amine oxidase domain-containing protein n=1 Tax=Aspergillus brasiliensis TaxID=319629 RepID=A0A9W6DLW6_9EURO|nr:hypothetical protein AbraCBS73388_005238 [Aspergillus brasiliensis]GKZ45565.1 hypothetical protein AbraIFM66951_008218 [Aspergillus brasiliensis]
MNLFFTLVCTSLVSTVIASALPAIFDTSNFHTDDIIQRDVAIIGGGSAGTHAAISLKDKGKSVIVVEKQDRLGGHIHTYLDPETGTFLDSGARSFYNITTVQKFFSRFNISLAKQNLYPNCATRYYDFRTGKAINRTLNPSQDDVSAALNTYLAQYNKYPGLRKGNFLPSPVPEDLYMPFGKFVDKYGIQAAVRILYSPENSDLLSNPVVEVFRSQTAEHIEAILSNTFVSPADYPVSEAFTRAAAELSANADLLLSSEVVHAHRPEHTTTTDTNTSEQKIHLIIRTPTGLKLILAQKLLIAIPPRPDFLHWLDLTPSEQRLFTHYTAVGFNPCIIRNSGLPPNTTILNAALHHTQYDLPNLSAVFAFLPTSVPHLHYVIYMTQQTPEIEPVPIEAQKAEIMRTLRRLKEQNLNLDVGFIMSTEQAELVEFREHAPYDLQLRVEAIREGVYGRLNMLQGSRGRGGRGRRGRGRIVV